MNAKKRKEIYLSNITDNNRIELNKDISEYSLPRINSENHAFTAFSYGALGYDEWVNDISYGVRPVVYLKSNVKIVGGTGESGNPYVLKQ